MTKYKSAPIKVTKWHIARGTPEDSDNCAIALAIRGRFRTKDVSVRFIGGIRVADKLFHLPMEAAEFIRQFDDLANNDSERRALKPFSFRLEERR